MGYETDIDNRLDRVDDLAEQLLSTDEYQQFEQVRDDIASGNVEPDEAASLMNTLRLELVKELDAAKAETDDAYTERDKAETEEASVDSSGGHVYRHGGDNDLDTDNDEADEHAANAASSYESFQRLRGDYQELMSVDDTLREELGDAYEDRRMENAVDELREQRGQHHAGDPDAYDTRLEKKDLRAKES